MEKVNIQKIKKEIIEYSLKNSGWIDLLKSYLYGEEFTDVLNMLLEERDDGKRFTPRVKDVFNGFKECPYSNLKVVIIGNEPYTNHNVNDGIAFSCGNQEYMNTYLRFILEEVNNTIYPNEPYDYNPSLKRWSNQGVLLINCSLTTRIKQEGKHYYIWKDFLAFLLDMLDDKNLIWVLIGDKASECRDLLSEDNIILERTHPHVSIMEGKRGWDSNNLFKEINEQLIKKGSQPIIW